MIIKILGIADLFVALVVLVNTYFPIISFPHSFIVWTGTYILIKGICFALVLDFTSFIDIACGIIILLTLTLAIPKVIMAIVFFYIFQKGVISLIS